MINPTASGYRFVASVSMIFGYSLLLVGSGTAQTFTEVGEAAGVNDRGSGFGVAVADYDNDGDLDLYHSTFRTGPSRLFRNEGEGTFVEVGEAAGVRDDGNTFGPAWADYDSDGDLDLFVAKGARTGSGPNRLYRNRGDGTFDEVAAAAGVVDEEGAGAGIAWGDYDRDGDLDLYIVNHGDPNRLFANQGDGTFVDVAAAAGVDEDEDVGRGVAWGDYDHDGDLDLIVTGGDRPNRLYENQGDGTLVGEVAGVSDDGAGTGVAWADYDEDGDLDLYLVNNGGVNRLYANQDDGTFIDVGSAAGVNDEGIGNGVAWADYDQDGDLDLYLSKVEDAGSAKRQTTNSEPGNRLFRNEGDGTFVQVAAAAGVNDEGFGFAVAWFDYDNDGDLDLYVVNISNAVGPLPPNAPNRLYRNDTTGHAWLSVEAVGTVSNRSGIGTVVTAVTGTQRQRREVDGGSGYLSQPSLPVEFGLGSATNVDSLIVAWPSGLVEVLTDLPASQAIRVIEGQGEYHRIQPTAWVNKPRSFLAAGSVAELQATVRPGPFEANAEVTQVWADLSRLGGPETVPLTDRGDGTWRLDTSFEVVRSNGLKDLQIQIDQVTSLGTYGTRLATTIAVLPTEDQAIFGDALGADWRIASARGVKLDEQESTVVFEGTSALALRGLQSFRRFTVNLAPAEPVGLVGYSALRFAFHPGDATLPAQGAALQVRVGLPRVDLLSDEEDGISVDMSLQEWQVIEIPFETINLTGRIGAIRFEGAVDGTLYIDDIRLVASPLPPSVTAVVEERTAALPQSFGLDQNYPNPFNSGTVIRFALPARTEVELELYNLVGQQVATLVRGVRDAGMYAVNWDGRDTSGRDLASGVYIYRLRAGTGHVKTRKLLMLR